MKKLVNCLSCMLMITTLLIGCGKEEVVVEQDYFVDHDQEPIIEIDKEKTTDNSFPVPINHNGKKVKITDLPVASQDALWWVYDFFNTEGIESEEELYELIKEKYRKGEIIPESIDTPEKSISGYGTEMLPGFEPNRIVESIVINVEIPEGLILTVPMYIKLKEEDNMRAVAIVYNTNAKRVHGADVNFPMPKH